MVDETRKLVTIRKIAALDPILNADKIEVATVDGWKVVTQKGQFKVGDYCLYAEIDSFLPESDPRFAFLMKNSIRTFNGIKGHKLKTIKLRKQISQGLIMPLSEFPEIITLQNMVTIPSDQQEATGETIYLWNDENYRKIRKIDFASVLGIQKYEVTIPAQLAGTVRGNFPSFIPKTDQERAQNLKYEIFEKNIDSKYEVTIKLDGSSSTFYHRDNVIGACSRNLDLKLDDENKENSFVRMLFDSNLYNILPKFGNIAIQGELMGTGIQQNREKLPIQKLYIFDIFNIDQYRYYTVDERYDLIEKFKKEGIDSDRVDYVPILWTSVTLPELDIVNIEDLLTFADGKSLHNDIREGVVFKRHDGNFSFKVISNKFLLQSDE